MTPSVCVTIVTYNSHEFIESCLCSVLSQSCRPREIVVVDNASTDGTRELLECFEDRIRVIHNDRNTGFAAAQNEAIAASSGDWVLVLNPDVVLPPDFLETLLETGENLDPRIGTLCGRLLSTGTDPPLIDSAGMIFTPALRHFDRGWREPDDGRFGRTGYVAGASAAAALYRREMIEDISDGPDFFDPDFFAYREDADVAWRAQLLGWRCLYVPDATAHHVRRVGPGDRRRVPAAINMHSVKNRFLMRIKNVTPGIYRRFWLPVTVRDILVIFGCLLWEPASLPAFWHLVRCVPRALRRRRSIMRRRKVDDESLAIWFQDAPGGGAPDRIAMPIGWAQRRRS